MSAWWRSVVKAIVPRRARSYWHFLVGRGRILRHLGPLEYLRWTWVKAELALRARRRRGDYAVLSDTELRASRRSHKVFIFGSGYSLNDLNQAEWAEIQEHDVFGFSGFIYEAWIRVDYHLIRGWNESLSAMGTLRRSGARYAERLEANPWFRDTVLILQNNYTAIFARTLLGHGLLASRRRLFLYKNSARLDDRPSPSLQGINHGVATLFDCVNVAYLMGWTEIVLVGVDLYDSRYFFGPVDGTMDHSAEAGELVPSETTGGYHWTATHSVALRALLDLMKQWSDHLAGEGVRITVYNPRSLLAEVLQVYARKGAGRQVGSPIPPLPTYNT